MPRKYNDKEKEFVLGLEELTRRTGIALGGCGCCGSPYLIKLYKHQLVGEAGYGRGDGDIEWIAPPRAEDVKLKNGNDSYEQNRWLRDKSKVLRTNIKQLKNP